MASGEQRQGGGPAPANDSIDELLDGLPADPMLPRKRARSIEEVKAAAAPSSQNRREGDNVIVSEGTDPREIARRESDRERRESSTFGTAFLQARMTREKIIFGVLMMLAVLGIYAFVRHSLHSEPQAPIAPAVAQSVQSTPSSSAPVTAADIPPPPASAVAPTEPASTTSLHPPVKAAHAGEIRPAKPPSPPASASAGRNDVARSL